MGKKKVYLSGPISGYDHDIAASIFADAADRLRAYDLKPVNPTKTLLFRWRWLYRIVGYRMTLLYDMWILSRCDFIMTLPYWTKSNGAWAEWRFARSIGVEPVDDEVRAHINEYIHDKYKGMDKPKPCVNRGTFNESESQQRNRRATQEPVGEDVHVRISMPGQEHQAAGH